MLTLLHALLIAAPPMLMPPRAAAVDTDDIRAILSANAMLMLRAMR